MDTIFNRIKAIINLYGFTPSGFEKQCGISCGTITTPLRLNKGIGYRALSRICATSHVNVAWLHDGTAPVFNCDCISDHIVDTLFKNGKTIPDFEIATGNPKHSFQREAVLRTMSKNRASVWIEELQKYLPEADYSWLNKFMPEADRPIPNNLDSSYHILLEEVDILKKKVADLEMMIKGLNFLNDFCHK